MAKAEKKIAKKKALLIRGAGKLEFDGVDGWFASHFSIQGEPNDRRVFLTPAAAQILFVGLAEHFGAATPLKQRR